MPKLDRSELAQQYGFALAFLKSDKSLWSLFNDAVKNDWEPDKFVAKLKTTQWYKKNGESARQYELLKHTDRASWQQQLTALQSQIMDRASQLGAVVNGTTASRIAQNAMKFGWNDSQVQDTLSQYVRAVNGVYGGSTGNSIDSIKSTAYRNGIRMSKATEQRWAEQLASGSQSAEWFQQHIRKLATSLAPGYADQLNAGLDLQDIVSPFVESKAKLLEMDPADIDLFDKDIRAAVSGTTKDGKPATKSLWQFEQDIRGSSAWLKTQNAQDSVMSTAKKVLADFGFQGVG